MIKYTAGQSLWQIHVPLGDLVASPAQKDNCSLYKHCTGVGLHNKQLVKWLKALLFIPNCFSLADHVFKL